MITYHAYIYIGTNEDFLNNGGPHPKERTLLQALQASLSKHLENTNPMPIEIITGKRY